MITTGVNGFGRFGLHLLKFWLDRNSEANFKIDYINDDFLTLEQAFEIINTDPYVVFNKYKVQIQNGNLVILEPNGSKHTIHYTNAHKDDIPWVGEVDVFLECSGKNTVSSNCESFLTGKTKLVQISATSWDCDKTLVYGFNHEEFDITKHKVISYGSCTVNAFTPFAQYLQNTYGINNCDVNVVHNIQEYRLKDNYTLIRKFCTLEKSATQLLDYITEDNFIVTYTVTPYTGVSMIDFRFSFDKDISRDQFVSELETSTSEGDLKGLYNMDEVDIGPEPYNCTPFSTVFIKEGIKKVGNNIYVQGYFDTENSVNRYFDLLNYVAPRLK